MFSLFLQLNDLNEALTQQRVVSHLLNIRNKHLQEEMEERFEDSSKEKKKKMKNNNKCGIQDDDEDSFGERIYFWGGKEWETSLENFHFF